MELYRRKEYDPNLKWLDILGKKQTQKLFNLLGFNNVTIKGDKCLYDLDAGFEGELHQIEAEMRHPDSVYQFDINYNKGYDALNIPMKVCITGGEIQWFTSCRPITDILTLERYIVVGGNHLIEAVKKAESIYGPGRGVPCPNKRNPYEEMYKIPYPQIMRFEIINGELYERK
jgi:hypothetical protein